MTLIDLVVLLAVVVITVTVLKFNRIGVDRKLGTGAWIVLLTAFATGIFYSSDLVLMLIMPSLLGDAQTLEIKHYMYLNVRWVFNLTAFVMLCTGFLISNWENLRSRRAAADAAETVSSIARNSSDWIWQIDLQRRNIFSNDQVAKMLGYSRQELARLPLEKLVHSEDMLEINERLPRSIAANQGWDSWVLRCYHKDGGIRYLSTSGGPVWDESGAAVGFRGISRDVSFQLLQAKISSSLMTAAPDDIDQIINAALSSIAESYRLDRISIWWREGTADVFRRSHVATHGDLEPAPEHTHATSALPWGSKILSEGRILAIESLDDLPAAAVEDRVFLEAAGVRSLMIIPLVVNQALIAASMFSTASSNRAWLDAEQEELKLLTETLAVAYDRHVTMQLTRRREQDLARAERLAAMGSFSFSISSKPGEFPPQGVMETSQQMSQILGTDTNGANFEDTLSQVHFDDRPGLIEAFREVIEHGLPRSQDYRIVRPGGEIRFCSTHAEVDRDENGNVSRIFGSCSDITELATALAEIAQLRDRLEEENVGLREEIRAVQGFDSIVGESRALRDCLQQVAAVAVTDVPVLICGETGTGKELIAKSIHNLSARSGARIVSVNCATLPVELVESELFGHEKGAFTGAHVRRQGRFEQADGGTLFLDELGELPLQVQSKLLRVLQDGSFERLGGTETLCVDVRLIAATNRLIQQAVAKGEFRADLFYRISTFPIEVPTLRERADDIPLLAEHFVRKHAARFGKSVDAISVRMLKYLQGQEWPGNVRQLEGFIERSLIAMTGTVLSLEERDPRGPAVLQASLQGRRSSGSNLRDVERERIVEVLEQCNWIIDGEKGAAKMLELAPSTLRSKMKRNGIVRAV